MTLTPKQKASEIANKFYRGNVFTHSKEQRLIELEFARQNAIICVDEILDAIPDHTIKLLNYFREVKQEISKL